VSAHRFATPSLAATITCKCSRVVTTDRRGRIHKHTGCSWSGMVLKASAVLARTVVPE
jgi:hypothetical protein